MLFFLTNAIYLQLMDLHLTKMKVLLIFFQCFIDFGNCNLINLEDMCHLQSVVTDKKQFSIVEKIDISYILKLT